MILTKITDAIISMAGQGIYQTLNKLILWILISDRRATPVLQHMQELLKTKTESSL